MTWGRCLRCGAVGEMEEDHPDGRYLGVPVVDAVTGLLCRPCHLLKGRMDRAAGVEGGQPTVRLILGRRVTWLACLASDGGAVLLPAAVVADFIRVLACLVRQIPPDLPFDGAA